MTELLYKEKVYKIQGAIFEVYKKVGTGFLETVYQKRLEEELSLSNIPFEAQKEMGSLLLECCSSESCSPIPKRWPAKP